MKYWGSLSQIWVDINLKLLPLLKGKRKKRQNKLVTWFMLLDLHQWRFVSTNNCHKTKTNVAMAYVQHPTGFWAAAGYRNTISVHHWNNINVENNTASLFYQFHLLDTGRWSLTEKLTIHLNKGKRNHKQRIIFPKLQRAYFSVFWRKPFSLI